MSYTIIFGKCTVTLAKVVSHSEEMMLAKFGKVKITFSSLLRMRVQALGWQCSVLLHIRKLFLDQTHKNLFPSTASSGFGMHPKHGCKPQFFPLLEVGWSHKQDSSYDMGFHCKFLVQIPNNHSQKYSYMKLDWREFVANFGSISLMMLWSGS